MSDSSIRRPSREVNKLRRTSTQPKLRIGIRLRSVVKFLYRKMTPMKNKSMEPLTLSTNKQSINLTACSLTSPLP
jgi:predicted DNA-binding transcriptional regulator YafY